MRLLLSVSDNFQIYLYLTSFFRFPITYPCFLIKFSEHPILSGLHIKFIQARSYYTISPVKRQLAYCTEKDAHKCHNTAFMCIFICLMGFSFPIRCRPQIYLQAHSSNYKFFLAIKKVFLVFLILQCHILTTR